MQIIFRFLLLAATLCSTVDAVEPYTPHHSNPLLEPWRWRSFPKIGGQELQCLAEDRDGNLWFGTQDGIWRYDGLEWTRFGVNQGLDGTPVVAIVVSPSNTIFCASGLGIYAFSGNEWTRTFPLTGDMTWFFEDLVIGKSGSLWAASAWGVLHLQNESSTLYCLDEVGRAFRETFPSLDYVALPAHLATTETLDYAGLGLERSGDTVFGVIPGSPADSADIHLGDRLIAVDTVDGDRHLTIHRQRVEAPIQLDIHPRRGRGDLRHFSANDVCLSRDGTVWVAVSSGEIVHFAPATNIWRKYGKQDGLSIGELVNLLESTEGTIWAVSDDRERGINRFDGSRWSTLWLSAEGGIDLNPSILETQDGTIWVGGHEGILHAYREEKWEVYRSPEVPLPTTRIVGLLEETRDQLVMSEKMASLGNLVAGVAHEINNPMGAFNSAADTLKRCIERVTEIVDGSRSSDEIRKNRQYQRAVQLLIVITDNAVIAGGRVTRIVESLKKFAHLDEADYQQADLHESLDSIITLKEHELGDRISIRKSYGDIPLVACYASELNQVFMNVFNNAVESIEDRGEITISTVLGKGEVTLSMTDTGKGIPKDNLT